MNRARSAQRLDIADQIVDLGARQREIRHRSMRVRQERAKLIGSHAAARNCLEAWRALWDGTGGIAADNVAIGAPLPRDLRALGGVGMGGMRGKAGKHRQSRAASRQSFWNMFVTRWRSGVQLARAVRARRQAALPPRSSSIRCWSSSGSRAASDRASSARMSARRP